MLHVGFVNRQDACLQGSLATVPLFIDRPYPNPIEVTAFTQQGTATPGSGADYFDQSTLVTIAPGDTEALIEIVTLQDDLAEGTEVFTLQLINAVNAELTNTLATVQIIDDD